NDYAHATFTQVTGFAVHDVRLSPLRRDDRDRYANRLARECSPWISRGNRGIVAQCYLPVFVALSGDDAGETSHSIRQKVAHLGRNLFFPNRDSFRQKSRLVASTD